MTFRKYGGDGLPELMPGNGVAEDAVGDGSFRGAVSAEQGGGEMGMQDGWQDKAEFERQQEVVRGDVGERDTAVDGGFEEDGAVVPRVRTTWGSEDKEARKKAKKERAKNLKREKAARELKEKRENDAAEQG